MGKVTGRKGAGLKSPTFTNDGDLAIFPAVTGRCLGCQDLVPSSCHARLKLTSSPGCSLWISCNVLVASPAAPRAAQAFACSR
eukprot:249842-Hanusia_phi.AAC.2